MHSEALLQLREYLNSQVIGQTELVNQLLVALLADGHILVEGPPGLAKPAQSNPSQIASKVTFTESSLLQICYLLI